MDALAPHTLDPDFSTLLALRPSLSLHAMDGLCFEDFPLQAIADRFGSPTYVYGAGTIRARLASLRAALGEAGLGGVKIHYAVKANDHLAILALLHGEGVGADVVSGGELRRARHVGIEATHIVFSGVGKTAGEFALALDEGVGQINVESAEELAMLSAIAASRGAVARVAFRVNPDVDAGTHAKITTGLADNKFGIAYADILSLYAHAASLPGIEPVGLAVHIGSQIVGPAPFAAAFARIRTLVGELRAAGRSVRKIDLGGGLGISYRDEPGISPLAYAHAVRAAFADADVSLMIEPGRFLVGPAGLLLAKVILQKQAEKRFVVLDAAMNDLVRPAMYDAWHGIMPVRARDAVLPTSPADVVGPVCESADSFAADRNLPDLPPGSPVAILDAGAYGAVMATTYNARPRAAAVLVDRGEARLITPRGRVEDLWADELWTAGQVAGGPPPGG